MTERSLGQSLLALQAGLSAFLGVLFTAWGPRSAAAALLVVAAGSWFARHGMARTRAAFVTRVAAAERARAEAEHAAHAAGLERDRATQLEATVLQLQRLESIGRLAGGVAHAMNNVLTVIGASVSMAERAVSLGASATQDFDEIKLAVGRASELTKQLLAFARQQLLVKESVDVQKLVAGVERLLGRVLGPSVTLSIAAGGEALRVRADAAQLERVLVNLVLNARDALGAAGSIQVQVQRCTLEAGAEAEGLAPGDYACIEVRDNGCGMSADVRRRLFEPFFTTKPAGKGTGLGLATSFGIVRQHDGTIRVESSPGSGTAMRVLLPLAAAEAPATSGVVPVVAKRPRVLIAEDEPQVRAIAARALTSAGFEVHQAANGALALAQWQELDAPFDVLVTDVIMPELSGPELARAARKLQPALGMKHLRGSFSATCASNGGMSLPFD